MNAYAAKAWAAGRYFPLPQHLHVPNVTLFFVPRINRVRDTLGIKRQEVKKGQKRNTKQGTIKQSKKPGKSKPKEGSQGRKPRKRKFQKAWTGKPHESMPRRPGKLEMTKGPGY